MSENINGHDIRWWLINAIDVHDAAVGYATEGMVSTSDLWWLYEEHRIMASADAWILAAMWEDQLPEMVDDQAYFHPEWWKWCDRGIFEARYRDRS